MVHRCLLGLAVLAFSAGAAAATPLETALNIQETKNPLGLIFKENHGCNLIAPPTDFLINDTKPGAAAPGGITIPKLATDGETYDLSGSGAMCPVPRVSTDGSFPVKVDPKKKGVTTSIAYVDDITASLKLTLGDWLKVVDFDASNIQEVGIWVNTQDSPAFNPDLNWAAGQIIADQKPPASRKCSTISKPANLAKAQIITRACVGKITISLVAKKDMDLNAFDIQFQKLTVGLKANWHKDIVGASSDCTVDASGVVTNAPAAPDAGAANPSGATHTGAAATTPAPAAATGGDLIQLSLGSIEATYKGKIDNVVSKPTAEQLKKVSTPAAKPAPAAGTPAAAAPTAGPPAPASPAPGATATDKPAAKNSTCAKNVVYQVDDPLVIGVLMVPAKPFVDDNQ